MYLTRIAGIETYSGINIMVNFRMYLTRIAGIETVFSTFSQSITPSMYLTRIAGIETTKLPFVFLWMLSDVSYPNNGN